MNVSVSVINPHDYRADWGLWLTAAAQDHKNTVPHYHTPEEIKIQNSKSGFH